MIQVCFTLYTYTWLPQIHTHDSWAETQNMYPWFLDKNYYFMLIKLFALWLPLGPMMHVVQPNFLQIPTKSIEYCSQTWMRTNHDEYLCLNYFDEELWKWTQTVHFHQLRILKATFLFFWLNIFYGKQLTWKRTFLLNIQFPFKNYYFAWLIC